MYKRFGVIVLIGSSLFAQTPTNTALISSNNPAQLGQTITLTATVSPTAVGTVMFLDGFEILGTAVLGGSSVAMLPIRFTSPRIYRLRAVYAGAPGVSGSTSAPLSLAVKALPVGQFVTSFTLPAHGLLNDVNADGKPDIIGSDTRVYLANGNGSYQGPITSTTGITGTVADFNNDGKPDLITDQGQLALGNGDGTWAAPHATSLVYRVTNYRVDLNRDGKADAVVGVPPLGHGQATTSYYLGNGSGGFGQPAAIPAAIGFADFNGNATADGVAFPSSNVTIPVGAFEFFDLNPFTTVNLAIYPAAGILIGDVNGDGMDDVVTNQTSDSVHFQIVVQLSNGAGGLAGQATVGGNVPYQAVQLLDWNGDSKLDILTVQQSSSNASTIGYLPGLGNGAFGPLVTIAPIPGSGNISVTEVNGDGLPDLLVTSAGNQAPVVFLGASPVSGLPGYTAPLSISPNAGNGTGGSFIAKYRASAINGALNPAIALEYLLFNTSVSGAQGCFIEANPLTNQFRLWSDAFQEWLGPLKGGVAQGLGNGRCTLAGAGSQAGAGVVDGSALEYQSTLNLLFDPSFAGPKNIYLLSLGTDGSNSGWAHLGEWTVPATGGTGPTGGVPSVAAFTPALGSGAAGTFTGAYSHTAGTLGHYLGYMLFLPTPNVVNFVATGSCLVEYNRISNGMRLVNDAGTGWLGGVSGITVGQPGNTLSNSACTVNVAGASVSVAGNTMTVNVPVTFASNFGPVLGTFLQELDVNDHWTGMTQFGNWNVLTASQPAPGPSVVSTTIQGGNAPLITITANGGASLPTQVHLRIGASIVGSPVCHVVYAPIQGTIALINDAETALVSGFVPVGTNQTIGNSRCSFNAAGVTRTVSGAQATLAVPLALTGFLGNTNVYVNVFDDQGRLTHWRTYGPIVIP